MSGAVTEAARAKVNLTLAVTGRRSDGYHILDSMVGFADVADELALEKSSRFELSVEGPFAGHVPNGDANLIARAARLLLPEPAVRITLRKNLPVAAGLGGGSADAAATLRGLVKLFNLKLASSELSVKAAALGADVPVCLLSCACRMTGVGEVITPLIRFRRRYAVLVNPGVPLGTAAVFREFDARLDRGLRGCRNDLTAAAKRVAPKIAEVLDALEAQPRIMTVRMSGSGPTCFGLFPSADTADYACQAIAASYPAWWCRRAVLT